MAADSYVQILPNSTGAKVDVSELTVGSNTVERQRMVTADPTLDIGLQHVKPSGEAMVGSDRIEFLLEQMVTQMRMMNLHLMHITGITVDDREASLSIFN